jgi:hypothetical protein
MPGAPPPAASRFREFHAATRMNLFRQAHDKAASKVKTNQPEEPTMFRKFMIATAAVATLGAAALSTTAASAGWHGHRHFRGHGPFIGVGFYNDGYYGGECYMQKRLVMTRYGERWRWVRVCY